MTAFFIMDSEKECRRCLKTKNLAYFTKIASSKDGRRNICKDCYCWSYYGRGSFGNVGEFKLKSKEFSDGTKQCTCCLEIKSTDNFNVKYIKVNISLNAVCKNCLSIKNKCRKYGITAEQYYSMNHNQNGLCKICHQKDPNGRNLYVDHCHDTNVIRGLLCSNCNVAIGLFKENTTSLRNAIKYIEENNLNHTHHATINQT